MTLNEVLEKLEYVANNPKKMLQDYIKSGKKVVGCFPMYTPEEIAHAGGLVPMSMWGGNTNIERAKEYYPAFVCSIIAANVEYGLKGSYDGVSAVMIPCMCDTLRSTTQNWKSGVKIPMVAFAHPHNRKIQAGVDYLVEEYESVKKRLEDICECEITEDAMLKSIDIYNEHRKVMQEFVELVPNYLNTITPTRRNAVIKSGNFMLKEDHTLLVKELNEILKSMPKEDFKGKKVMTTGIVLDDKGFLEVLEKNNLAVAYDNVGQETRQFSTLVPEGNSALERLALQWSNIEGCSLAYDPQRLRGKIVADHVKRLGIDGVIYGLMKFCDPEEYDYPIFKKDMDEAGIPHLYMEIEQGTSNIEQMRTRIQTFADIIS